MKNEREFEFHEGEKVSGQNVIKVEDISDLQKEPYTHEISDMNEGTFQQEEQQVVFEVCTKGEEASQMSQPAKIQEKRIPYQVSEHQKIRNSSYCVLDQTSGEFVLVKKYKYQDFKKRRVDREKLKSLMRIQYENQKNFCQYIQFQIDENRDVDIVMEYIGGMCIANMISEFGKVPIPQIKRLCLKIIHSLKILHQNNLIHGNLKSSNVLLTKDGFCAAKLTDVNIWPLNTINIEELYINRASAPELFLGTHLPSKKSDIWSVGYIALEMFLGREPWIDKEKKLLTHKEIRQFLRQKKRFQLPSSLPEDFREFLQMTLQDNPEKRSTCAELLNQRFLKVDITSREEKQMEGPEPKQLRMRQNSMYYPVEQYMLDAGGIRSKNISYAGPPNIPSDSESGQSGAFRMRRSVNEQTKVASDLTSVSQAMNLHKIEDLTQSRVRLPSQNCDFPFVQISNGIGTTNAQISDPNCFQKQFSSSNNLVGSHYQNGSVPSSGNALPDLKSQNQFDNWEHQKQFQQQSLNNFNTHSQIPNVRIRQTTNDSVHRSNSSNLHLDFPPENSDYFIIEEQSINLLDSKMSEKSSEARSNFKGNEDARKALELAIQKELCFLDDFDLPKDSVIDENSFYKEVDLQQEEKSSECKVMNSLENLSSNGPHNGFNSERYHSESDEFIDFQIGRNKSHSFKPRFKGGQK